MRAMNPRSAKSNMNGFTLVELMIVVLLTGIAVIAIYRGYNAVSQSADAQEQVIELQQNLRIGMYFLEKDLRRAGMNEEDDEFAGFEAAGDAAVTFSMDLWGNDSTSAEDLAALDALDGTTDGTIEDLTGDGDVNDFEERISYFVDANGNFIRDYENDAQDCTAILYPQCILITNVDALNFVYLDEDRNLLVPDVATGLLSEDERNDIRTIQACMVVRTTNEDMRYTNNESYANINPAGPEEILGPQGDHFRRRAFCKEIKIRNAGL